MASKSSAVLRLVQPGFNFALVAEFPPEGRRIATEAQNGLAWQLARRLLDRANEDDADLPAFPAIAAKILNLMDEPNPDLDAMVEVISQDAMISAQVLRMASSAFYSRGAEVTSVKMAAARLGVRAVSSVAVAAATRALLDAQERESNECFRESWRALADYSIVCAVSARWLSTALGRADSEQAFLGGLLHDLGKMVALRVAGQMVQTGDLSATVAPIVLERVLELAHIELGVNLSAIWELPGIVGYVCGKHHESTPGSEPVNDALHVVRIASALTEARINPLHRPELERELTWSASALGIEPGPLQAIAAELKVRTSRHRP